MRDKGGRGEGLHARARFQSIRIDPSIRARIRDQSETSSLFVRALNPSGDQANHATHSIHLNRL